MSCSNSLSRISVRRGVANCVLHLEQLLAHQREQLVAVAQQLEVALDQLGDLARAPRRSCRAPARSGAAGAGRGWRAPGPRTAGRCRLRRYVAAGLGDQRDQRRHVGRRPVAAPSAARAPPTGSGARRIISITSSMLATAMARPTSTWARSRAWLSSNLVRRVMTSARKRDEGLEQLLEGHQPRPAAVERQHVDAEARLQRREAVELVQHDVGHRVALQLDHQRARRRGRSRRGCRRCPRSSCRAPPRRCARCRRALFTW